MNSIEKLLKENKAPGDSIKILLEEIESDSLKNEIFFKYSYYLFQKNDSLGFLHWNRRALETSVQLNDTSKIAESYWDLANFFYRKNQDERAFLFYNKAFELYDIIGKDFLAGRMLLNTAIIQNNIKDYVGSEVTTIKAIERIKPLGKAKQLYMAYNNLGVLNNELGEFERAIQNHEIALKYAEELNDSILWAASLNNIGVVYKNEENYGVAKEVFKKAFNVEHLFSKNTRLYAMVLDNWEHSKLLENYNETLNPSIFFHTLKIRDSIGHDAGIIINKLHLGDYYLFKKDTLEAVRFGNEAKYLAEKTNNYRDLLNSILFLSKIDNNNSKTLLYRYISLNDSLQLKERAVRNKFARISYETDEFIARNEDLKQQRKWLLAGSLGSILILFLSIIIRSQKAKNKKLELERDQQKANEEIYNLLLDQEKKLEEGRMHEKKRISQDLHDGVLGKIFGIRFILSNLNSKYDPSSIEVKEKHLNELRLIEEEIRNISHDLQNKLNFEEASYLTVIQNLLNEKSILLGFTPVLKADAQINWEKINNKMRINIYRIIQEAIQNIYKYSGADKLSICFYARNRKLLLIIKDNGKGFDVLKNNHGIGLKNMKSRIKDMRGNFNISSNNQGTTINIEIPV